jgi:hypothetical protein
MMMAVIRLECTGVREIPFKLAVDADFQRPRPPPPPAFPPAFPRAPPMPPPIAGRMLLPVLAGRPRASAAAFGPPRSPLLPRIAAALAFSPDCPLVPAHPLEATRLTTFPRRMSLARAIWPQPCPSARYVRTLASEVVSPFALVTLPPVNAAWSCSDVGSVIPACVSDSCARERAIAVSP